VKTLINTMLGGMNFDIGFFTLGLRNISYLCIEYVQICYYNCTLVICWRIFIDRS
jgi:hypothetical protein